MTSGSPSPGQLDDYQATVNMAILQVVQNQSVTLFQQLSQNRLTDFDIHSQTLHCFGG